MRDAINPRVDRIAALQTLVAHLAPNVASDVREAARLQFLSMRDPAEVRFVALGVLAAARRRRAHDVLMDEASHNNGGVSRGTR